MPTILCVDDQSAGLAIRKQLLETKGYEVLLASNGPEAIALTRKRRVDLIILDYRMPGMDGEEIARILKAEDPARPIVLLTGYAGDIPQHLVSRVDGFVQKGNSASVLLSAVENAMRASKRRRSRSVRSENKRHSA